MAQLSTVFLDDGGVMNDNDRRAPQWARLVGEFLAPRLGREPGDWAGANSATFRGLFDRYEPQWSQDPLREFWDNYLVDWLVVMCEHIGVKPPDREESLAIAREANAYVTRRVHAAYPGAVKAIRQLHDQGYRLNTASAEHSDDLAGYLEAMGIRDLFGRLYGPDLVDLPFHGRQYYQRLLADSGTRPDEAVVVDDSPERVVWAIEAGASAVLVPRDEPAPEVAYPVIATLAELPRLLRTMEGHR